MVAPNSSSSSSKPAISREKLRANRRNAKKSTGPRTAAGKAKSAQNATTHGIFCRDLVLRGESLAIFRNIRESVIRRLRPQDMLELMLVDRIVSAQWRLNRCQRSEYMAHETEAQRALGRAQRKLDRTLRQWGVESQQAALEEFARDPAALDDPQLRVELQQLLSATADPDLYNDPGLTLLQGLIVGRSFDRLALYEQRLERSMQRAMAELRRLRDKSTRAWENLPPSPFEGTPVVTAEDGEEEEDDADEDNDDTDASLTPSPGTPGEGGGEGSAQPTPTDESPQPREPSPQPSPGVPGEGEEKNEPTAEKSDASAASVDGCDDAPRQNEPPPCVNPRPPGSV